MSQDKGLSAEQVVQKEALKRMADFQLGVEEIIKLNVKLESLSDRIASESASRDKDKLKNLSKLEAEYKNVERRRKRVLTSNRKHAKLNSIIAKRDGNTNLAHKRQLADINREKSKMLGLDKKLNRESKKTEGFVKRLGSSIKSAINPATIAFALITGGVVALYKEISKTIKLIKQLDSIELSMGIALNKSGEDADALTRSMGNLYLWSKKYGANLITLTNRYHKFIVASQQSNISMRDTEDIFETVTKAAGVMGLGNEELKGSLLALEQMMSKGKITTEELRRQLGERMPGAMGIMAKAYDKVKPSIDGHTRSTTEMIQVLDKAMKKGEVMTADVLPAFAEAMREAYGLDSIDNIDTLIASQERAHTAWIKMVESIDDGTGALSSLLKLWYEVKTNFFEWLTDWNEKHKHREYFALGVDSAKKSLAELLKMKEAVLTNELVKAGMSPEEIKKIDWEHIYNITELDASKENLEEVGKEIDSQVEFVAKVQAKYDKIVANKEDVSHDPVRSLLSWFGLTKDEKDEKNALTLLQNQKELLFDLQGNYDFWLRISNEEVSGHRKVTDAIKERSYQSRKLTKPMIKEFNEYGKTQKLLLSNMRKMYVLDGKNANNRKEMVRALDGELKASKKILDIEKEQARIKADERLKKDIFSIDKKILKNNETALKNNAKASKLKSELDENASNYLEIVKKIDSELSTSNLKKYNKILENNKKAVREKYDYDSLYYETVYSEKMNELERQKAIRNLKINQDVISGKLSIEDSKDSVGKDIELIRLTNKYDAQRVLYKNRNFKLKKAKEQFEKDKANIDLRYLRKELERSLFGFNRQLEFAEGFKTEYRTIFDNNGEVITIPVQVPNATVKDIEKLKAYIADATKKLGDLKIKAEVVGNQTYKKIQEIAQEIKAFLDVYKQAFQDLINTIGDSIDESYQRDIDKQQKALDNLKEYYQKQNDLAGDSTLKKRLLLEEELIAESRILKRKRALEVKQLKAKKRVAMFNAKIDAASAILNVFATTAPPASFILAGMVAVMTAIKIADISKEKIPEYRTGTNYHPKDGLALVGDGGVQEVVKEPNKEPYLTPSTPTYRYLKRGTKVFKSKAEFIKNQIKTQSKSNKSHTFVNVGNDVESAIKRGFVNAKINSNVNVSINNNNPYKSFKKL